jgi:hypothetical protein
MAEIRSSTLALGTDGSGEFGIITTVLRFSPRKVVEQMQYGLNAIIVAYDAGQQVFAIHSGSSAMHVVALPPSVALANFAVGSGSDVVIPNDPPAADGSLEITHRVKAYLTRIPNPGEEFRAVVSVVPEIAETQNITPTAVYS